MARDPRQAPAGAFALGNGELSASDMPVTAGASAEVAHARRVARAGIALLVALAVVAAVALGLAEGVSATIARTQWWGVVGALGLALASVMAEGAAMAMLAGDVRPGSVFRMARAYVTGGFVGMVTPWALGGGPTWLWALSREGVPVGEAAALLANRAVVASTFFALVGIVATAIVPTVGGVPNASILAVLVPLLTLGGMVYAARRPEAVSRWAVAKLERLGERTGSARPVELSRSVPGQIERFAEVVSRLTSSGRGALLGALVAIAISRFCQLLAIPVILAAQGSGVDVVDTLQGLLLVWFVSSVAPAPSGEGVAQGMVVTVFGPQFGSAAASAAALLWRALVFYPVFLVGGVLFARLLRGWRATSEASASVPNGARC
ncbi:MAG: lysylphosphatidylglycerol synthase transmembrane domain-containing protein [Coriobacteriales bacterium]|nr:flippase-like domain-containing protein [Actinomycetes bacterium]